MLLLIAWLSVFVCVCETRLATIQVAKNPLNSKLKRF